jgi:hypothetical protein
MESTVKCHSHAKRLLLPTLSIEEMLSNFHRWLALFTAAEPRSTNLPFDDVCLLFIIAAPLPLLASLS